MPRVEYVPDDHPVMLKAKELATESKLTAPFLCPKRPVIAVVMKGDKVISVGGNYRERFDPPAVCPREIRGAKTGELYYLCRDRCNQAYHAEMYALRFTKPEDTEGAACYLWGHYYACPACMTEMDAAGIEVLYLCESTRKESE